MDARRDRLIGDWFLYQRTGGHRTSTDDLITAWMAAKRTPERVERYLDLGSGIGSVLLMYRHKKRPVYCLGIEAQTQSYEMASRSVSELPKHDTQIELICSDFRTMDHDLEVFDVITGSPPYFPLQNGVLPKDSQRRDCRFESRGGVEAYIEKAERCLKEDGKIFLVFPKNQEQRLSKAVEDSSLNLHGKTEFVLKEENPKNTLGVYEMSFLKREEIFVNQIVIRDSKGQLTPEYLTVREELGVD